MSRDVAGTAGLLLLSMLAGCGGFELRDGMDREMAALARRPVDAAVLDREADAFRAAALPLDDAEAEAALAEAPTKSLVVDTALRRNPDIRAGLDRWAEAAHRVPQVSAYEFPRLSYVYRDRVRTDSFQLTQVLPFPGKLAAQGEAALALARAGRLDYEELRNALVASATGAYYELYLRRRELELVRENLVLLDRFIEIARALFGAGRASQQDVLKAEVERSRLAAQEAAAAGRAEVALAALNALLDRPGDGAVGPIADPGIPPERADRGALYDRALAHRPELLAAVERAHAADAGLRRAKLEYAPDFVVGGGYDSNRTLRDGGATAVLGISLPIWTGRIGAGIREARARARRRRHEVESARNKVIFEVKEAAALADAAAAEARIHDQETVPRARQALDVAEAEYQAGRIEFLSLVDAERLLLDAELARVRALARLEARRADLDRAVGGPEEETP